MEAAEKNAAAVKGHDKIYCILVIQHYYCACISPEDYKRKVPDISVTTYEQLEAIKVLISERKPLDEKLHLKLD